MVEDALKRRADKLSLILAVARQMSVERELTLLLPVVLDAACKVAEADRATIFLLDRERGELWTRLAQGVEAGGEIRTPIGVGIAGVVAATGVAIHIPDAYADARFNRSVDQLTGYHTKSLLTVPMTVPSGGTLAGAADSPASGTVVGVIQVLNRQGEATFTAEDQELLEGLGGQAASAIENTLLTQEIRSLFAGFVAASVSAIEARDPTTAGHSERVAKLTLGLARALEREDHGPHAGLRFNHTQLQEIRYAALLHDFGKVGVREHVLTKAKKLFPHELQAVQARVELIRRTRELESAERRIALLMGGKADPSALTSALQGEDERLRGEVAELDRLLQLVLACDQPTILEGSSPSELARYAERRYLGTDGTEQAYLTEAEVARLSIGRGSLSEAERHEIESHVVHTFEFLRRIPWTRDLRRVREIARGHHERLDGSGYPQRLSSPQIPVETRMMTVADIYDALTASDRPYKKAVPHERALGILSDEVKRQAVDPDLLRTFIAARVWDGLGT